MLSLCSDASGDAAAQPVRLVFGAKDVRQALTLWSPSAAPPATVTPAALLVVYEQPWYVSILRDALARVRTRRRGLRRGRMLATARSLVASPCAAPFRNATVQ
ncbi:MAG: hypothetical protein EOO41_01535 [Methanobacteriota archaeon]|nr:MAG: hypothetical protein EOO41_01535 [Euryarchaeota archaeon]